MGKFKQNDLRKKQDNFRLLIYMSDEKKIYASTKYLMLNIIF